MNDRELRLLAWFGSIEMCCRPELEAGKIPDWLKEEINQGRVRRAIHDAGLPRAAETEVAALTLAVFRALAASMPRPNAAVRKELRAMRKQVETLRYKLEPGRLKMDVAQVLWGDFRSEDQPDGTIEVRWEYDAGADLRAALDLFLARTATPDLAPHQGGTRPAVTTLAAVALVGLAVSHVPDIEAMPLAQLAERVLNPAIEAFEEQAKITVARPDWHDRVSKALAERRTPIHADGEK